MASDSGPRLPTHAPSERIETLTPADAVAFRDLRLRALREHPEAFATSEQEELRLGQAAVAGRLQSGDDQVTFGAFVGERLVGVAALVRPTRAKLRHRATLAGMYVVPEMRGRGCGRALLERAIDAAVAWGASDIALAVTVGNDAARALYARAGFISYAIEPRALLLEERFYDVEHMTLQLRQVLDRGIDPPGVGRHRPGERPAGAEKGSRTEAPPR
jgi:GNAT superfamily N-acetyltransferase